MGAGAGVATVCCLRDACADSVPAPDADECCRGVTGERWCEYCAAAADGGNESDEGDSGDAYNEST